MDVDVTLADQQRINEFGRLNARLHEARGESDALKKRLERLDDACTELMMSSGSHVHLMLGDAFIMSTEDDATAYCEEQVEKLQSAVDELDEEGEGIKSRQKELKKELYARYVDA